MNTAQRALAAGLMAAAFLTTSLGRPVESAYAMPISPWYASMCLDLTHDAALVASEYNNPATSAARKAELLEEYRGILGFWSGIGCDAFFGSLPLLQPLTTTGTATQVGLPGSQVSRP